MTNVPTIAIDIETTGLDPEDSKVLALGMTSHSGGLAVLEDNEADLLRLIEKEIQNLDPRALLVTWNGEEFDMPFLAVRYSANDLPSTLTVHRKLGHGKYGGPLYQATWSSHLHIDIAPLFRRWADRNDVEWKLKPVARALLGIEPIEVDRDGRSMQNLEEDRLRAYVLSDARITFELARLVLRSDISSKHQVDATLLRSP